MEQFICRKGRVFLALPLTFNVGLLNFIWDSESAIDLN
jgi:hypothetical protein